jgi:transcriptional regulator with XRE-family HTH domain
MGPQATNKSFAELSSIGDRLRWARIRKGLTVEQFAKAAGVHKTYVSKIETGKNQSPSTGVAMRMSQAAGIDYRWLVWGQPPAIPGVEPGTEDRHLTNEPAIIANVTEAQALTVLRVISKRIDPKTAALILRDLFDLGSSKDAHLGPFGGWAHDEMFHRAMDNHQSPPLPANSLEDKPVDSSPI